MQPIKPYSQWKERGIEAETGLKTERIMHTAPMKEKVHRRDQRLHSPAGPYAAMKPRTQLGKKVISRGKTGRKLRTSEYLKWRNQGHKTTGFKTGWTCECTLPAADAFPVVAPKMIGSKNKKRSRGSSQSTQQSPAKRRLINQPDEGTSVVPCHPDNEVSRKDLNGASYPEERLADTGKAQTTIQEHNSDSGLKGPSQLPEKAQNITPQNDDSDGTRVTPCDLDDNPAEDLQGLPEVCGRLEDAGKAQNATLQNDDSDGNILALCDPDNNHTGKDLQSLPELFERVEDTGKAQTTTQQHPDSEHDFKGPTEPAKRPENEKKTGRTVLPEIDPLLGVEIQFSNISFPVTAVIDTGAPCCTINLELAEKLGWQLRPGCPLLVNSPSGQVVSNKVVSAQFTIGTDKSRKFPMVASVLPTNIYVILGLSWLRENRFKINPIKRTLEHSDYSVECTHFTRSHLSKIPPGLWGRLEKEGKIEDNLVQHNNSEDALASASEPGEQPQDKGKPSITLPVADLQLMVEIQFSKLSFPVKALIDTGASGCIVGTTIAEKLGTVAAPIIESVMRFDGTQVQTTGTVFGEFTIGANNDRKFKLVADYVPDKVGCLLGLSWLRQNGFIINPMTRTLERPDYSIRCGVYRD